MMPVVAEVFQSRRDELASFLHDNSNWGMDDCVARAGVWVADHPEPAHGVGATPRAKAVVEPLPAPDAEGPPTRAEGTGLLGAYLRGGDLS